MQLLKDWKEEHIIPLKEFIKEHGWSKFINEKFHREEFVPIFRNINKFYSPAHGTVIYQKIVSDIDEEIVEIKGKNFSLKYLLGDAELKPQSTNSYIVIGIFLTAYDVHTQRLPSFNGIIYSDSLPCLLTNNLPMVDVEYDLVDNNHINFDDTSYLFKNERCVYSVFYPLLNMWYNMVLIADREVNMILPYYDDETALQQGDVFSKIQFGSQVDLIIPYEPEKYNYKLCVPDDGNLYHVTAGKDCLVEIYKK